MPFSHDTKEPVSPSPMSHHTKFGHYMSSEQLESKLEGMTRFTGLAGAVVTALHESGQLQSCLWVDGLRNFYGEGDYPFQALAQDLDTGGLAALLPTIAGTVISLDRDRENGSEWGPIHSHLFRAAQHRSCISKYNQPEFAQSHGSEPSLAPRDTSQPDPSVSEDTIDVVQRASSQEGLSSMDVDSVQRQFLSATPMTIVCPQETFQLDKGKTISVSDHVCMSNNRDPRLKGHTDQLFSMNDNYPGRSTYDKLSNIHAAVASYERRAAAQNVWAVVPPKVFALLAADPEVERTTYTKGQYGGSFTCSHES